MSKNTIRIERDLPYGEATVGYGTPQARLRPLLLDAYFPAESAQSGPASPRAALILSHGGAYHRGSKDKDEFEQDGSHNTPVHEYCEHFAAQGLVCFSVGYRLTQELAAPQPLPIKRNRTVVHRSRIDYVRGLLGLAPATQDEVLNGVEGAFADVANAFRFVQAQASRWNIDPHRIAMGGFSAGGFASAYAAYAMGMPAAAIIGLSAGMDDEDVSYYLHGARGQPPALIFFGEQDLPGIPERTRALAEGAEAAGLGVRRYLVPGKPHFYDRHSQVTLVQSTMPGGESCDTVEAAITRFLEDTLAPAEVSVEMLEAFAQAWSRHDIDTLMSFMADDCIFHSSSGPDVSGTRYVGREAVREGFMKAWHDIPDAQWTRARHFVAGPRGVSEWTFVGTRSSDGARLEMDGCDLFTFQGNKIRVKDSWRKTRIV